MMTPEDIRFAADWARVLLALRKAHDGGEGLVLSTHEVKVLIQGLRLVSNPKPEDGRRGW